MSKIVHAYFTLLKAIIVICLAAMVVMVFSNVVMRFMFNTGIPVSEELSRWCFVWLTFLGAILVLNERSHLGVDVVLQALGPRARRSCLVVSNLLMMYATWLILQGSIEQTMLNVGASAPASGLSQAWFFGVGVVFAATTGLILIYQLYQLLTLPAAQIDRFINAHDAGAE
ncbi:C4-dicarboxylate ABC transporter permease [Bordetella genomosp. 7]|uniref:TRAP transporter small permease n=1 Tax=Bordetella genomosp. 7 TaxID=1416805 RepID=UPI000B9DFE57|nr:TRAP transporter small permease [Bordetella genomosp. 7]OZI21705.1 C4-dicarboxylate ABC transporter permease [Bordetella genomosp. 7]